MSFPTDFSPEVYGHERLPDILDAVIPEVARELAFGELEGLENVDGKEITDQEILQAVEWDGATQRRRKWLLMAGEVVFRASQARERANMQSTRSTGLPRVTGTSTDVDWVDCYNEAANSVANYMSEPSTAEAVKSALRRETFDEERELSIPTRIPREVLRRVDARVREHDDVSVDGVVRAHRETIEQIS
jgi:hypothetical protein